MLPRSWKKPLNNGVVKPVRMRRCNNGNGEILCNECNIQINENRKIDGILNFSNRHAPNQFGYMLP